MNVKTTTAVISIIASLVFVAAANADVSDSDAIKLATKYGCQACHTVDAKLVGPTYKDVAKKYAGDKTAPEKLRQKVKDGGSGVWGPIPMPPAATAADADIATLVEWILSLN